MEGGGKVAVLLTHLMAMCKVRARKSPPQYLKLATQMLKVSQSYFQGASIIRMLEGFVGREKFKEGLSVSIKV